jgi:phage tail-like protein
MAINGAPKKFMSPKKYKVIVQGLGEIECSKLDGLEWSLEKMVHYEGGKNTPAAQLPGNQEEHPVTIERGRTLDHRLIDWAVKAMAGRTKVEDLWAEVTIEQLDLDDETLLAYTLHKAWPTGYKPGSWDKKGSEVVLESLTLAYESFDFTQR